MFATGLKNSMRFMATINRSTATLETSGMPPSAHGACIIFEDVVLCLMQEVRVRLAVTAMTAALAAYPDAFYSGIAFWANATSCKIVEEGACCVGRLHNAESNMPMRR